MVNAFLLAVYHIKAKAKIKSTDGLMGGYFPFSFLLNEYKDRVDGLRCYLESS